MRMTRIFKTALVLLVVVGVSSSVLAQQQAGAAVQEIHRRSNPNHPGYMGGNAAAAVSAPPREVWQSKYGAIALDINGVGAGVAESENSIKAARRVALQQCGSPGCKVYGTVANGCLAAANGGGRNSIQHGENEETAIRAAMSDCEASSGVACELRYAYCSLPVRIR